MGIGITFRGEEAGEDGRAGDEGRNVSEQEKEISIFLSANPIFDLLKDSHLRPVEEEGLHYLRRTSDNFKAAAQYL